MSDTAQGSRAGSQFGPYHLKRLLGRGGMGEVYEAEDTVKDRVVALKLMSATFSQDPVFRKRMQREAHTAGRLQEPHVVPIHDYGEIDGQLYLDMRLIEGTDLDALLKRFGPLEPPRAVAIIRQIASALDAAHAAGVMHRDVKPQNILITRDDFAYLVDFGIASATTDERLTQLGTAVGTWKYMAPERLSNDEVTYRADIYALTCVLHECLTGSPPYRADSASVLVTAHLYEPIPRPSQERPSIPKAFDEVIARGMAKKPEDRYASAGDLALAAHQALSTPDQDQAATLLRQSQEAVLPGPAATLAPTFVPSPPHAATPTPTPAASTASPDPAGSGPLPRSTPPPTLTWAPDSGPIPAGGQPTASPQFLQGGGWPGQPATPPPPQPSSPPSWTPPSPRKPNPWLLLGIAALVVVAVLGGLGIWLATRPTPPPAPTLTPPERLSSLLLSPAEINAIMGSSTMQPGNPIQAMDTSTTLSNPDCQGALYGIQDSAYAGSGETGVSGLISHEPGDNHDHWIAQSAVSFPSIDKARAFVQTSGHKWKTCAGQTVTNNDNGQTVRWTFGNLTGASPRITQVDTQEAGGGWSCQRALSAVSNVVIDVNACGNHITNEAAQITDKMAAKVTE